MTVWQDLRAWRVARDEDSKPRVRSRALGQQVIDDNPSHFTDLVGHAPEQMTPLTKAARALGNTDEVNRLECYSSVYHHQHQVVAGISTDARVDVVAAIAEAEALLKE